MRIRIRGPKGQSTITLPADATAQDLKAKITECTDLVNFSIRYGYPPQELDLDLSGNNLSGLSLDGEQLIIGGEIREEAPSGAHARPPQPKQTPHPTQTPSSSQQQKPLAPTAPSFSRNQGSDDPPELSVPSRNATLVLRIMPDDNSCLFRAFNSAYFGLMDNMHELRSVIAQEIQEKPEIYSAAVLEKPPDDYCRWIQHPDAWGGQIELQILSQRFDVEICSIDVQTLRVDRYNEGQEKRCILVYSGIHYDVVALSPSDPPYHKSYAPPDFDVKIFEATDEHIIQRARDLCKILQNKGYFTDTAHFTIRCNDCGGTFTGEKEAIEHASTTGHNNFGQA